MEIPISKYLAVPGALVKFSTEYLCMFYKAPWPEGSHHQKQAGRVGRVVAWDKETGKVSVDWGAPLGIRDTSMIGMLLIELPSLSPDQWLAHFASFPPPKGPAGRKLKQARKLVMEAG